MLTSPTDSKKIRIPSVDINELSKKLEYKQPHYAFDTESTVLKDLGLAE
jgi:hypothetical protein